MSDGEFRVVWRWRSDHPVGDLWPTRRRVFQTLVGAQRLYDRLTSNGGRFTKAEDGDHGELIEERLRLDFARIEAREVGPFLPVSGSIYPESVR